MPPSPERSISTTSRVCQWVNLRQALHHFAAYTGPTQSQQHIKPLHWYVACRLVLAGWGAGDNPEGMAVLAELREAAGVDADVHVLVLPPDATIEINALQRAATVVVHVPRQEDFGLLAAEAMWKGKPVVASLAGGLSTQVITDVTGYTVTSVEGAALRIRQLLEDPDLVGRLGGAAREYVRRSFLITRHLGDYLALLASLTS